METICDVDQLYRNPNFLPRVILAHTAFQQGFDVQFFADGSQVFIFAFESKGSCPTSHLQALDVAENI